MTRARGRGEGARVPVTSGRMSRDYCRHFDRLVKKWGPRVRVVPSEGGFCVVLFNGRRTTGWISWGSSWMRAIHNAGVQAQRIRRALSRPRSSEGGR